MLLKSESFSFLVLSAIQSAIKDSPVDGVSGMVEARYRQKNDLKVRTKTTPNLQETIVLDCFYRAPESKERF